jgi:hypothetical protein
MYVYTVSVDPANREVAVTPGQEPDMVGQTLGQIIAQNLNSAVAEHGRFIKR